MNAKVSWMDFEADYTCYKCFKIDDYKMPAIIFDFDVLKNDV
jgi:hypothetical protein